MLLFHADKCGWSRQPSAGPQRRRDIHTIREILTAWSTVDLDTEGSLGAVRRHIA